MSLAASGNAEQRRQSRLFRGLASSGLFAQLTDDAVRALAGMARVKSYIALQEAVTEGQSGTEVEIVTSGRFVVLLPSEQIDLHASGSFNLHLYLPGDSFGLWGLAAAAPAPATASIIASEPSTTIAIPTAGLRRVLDGDHTAAAVVYRNLFAIQTGRLGALGAQ